MPQEMVQTVTLLLTFLWLGLAGAQNNSTCGTLNIDNKQAMSGVTSVLSRGEASLLLLLGFGVFSVLLAVLYNFIRRNVFFDADNLNTTFDAGGHVSVSLTAVTVTSQLLWPGDLLQSATVTVKNGISGAFWYSTSAVINMILFPVLSVQFKTRAPGAKTFLQVIHARFGMLTHLVFCCFALLLNLVIVAALVAAAVAMMQSLIEDASDEFCVLILATLFGSYSFLGGLGTTFYVSYFNTAIIFCILTVFIVQVFYLSDGEFAGGFKGMYEHVYCLQGPNGNAERSYITFWSEGAVIWAIQGLFATASITFCDQASWQSRIAAKPMQGVLGFFVATYMWFAIPSTIGTSVGMAYLDLSSHDSSHLLSQADIDAGLVATYIMQQQLGVAGSYMILILLVMALMSTGSGEVMAVSSIIVFDICQTHILPFRKSWTPGHCQLCGLPKPKEIAPDFDHVTDTCRCAPAKHCPQCESDSQPLKHLGPSKLRIYQCPTHGEFRVYQEYLMMLKSWVILWVTLSLVPLGMLVLVSGMDLNWVMMCGFIMTVPSFPGVLMTILWVKTTSIAMMIGSLSGLIGGVIANLIMASTFEGGLSNFMKNTSEYYSVLAGSSTAFGFSLGLTIVISLCTHNIHTEFDEKVEWQRLRDIDNPLHPWAETYEDDFPHLTSGILPSYEEMSKVFHKAKLVAYIGGAVSIVIFVIFIPGLMMSLYVLSVDELRRFMMSLHIWCFLMTLIVVVLAPVEEMSLIFAQLRRNKRIVPCDLPDTMSAPTDAETPGVGPQTAETPEVVPQTAETPEVVPQMAETPEVVPHTAETPGVVPQTAETPEVLSQTAETPGVLPRTSDIPGVLLRSAETPGVLPQTAETPGVLPQTFQSHGELAQTTQTSKGFGQTFKTPLVFRKPYQTSGLCIIPLVTNLLHFLAHL